MKLKVNGNEFLIPEQNIVPFALHQAMQRGIMSENIHNIKTAIEYLNNIGIEVIE
jgi:hypothetical protein